MSKDKPKPHEKQTTIAGVKVVADPSVPPGEAHVKDASSATVAKIVNMSTESKPSFGWSSKRAEDLVKAVPAAERELLLGDLLAQLAPHSGQTGENETATDTLQRLLRHLEANREHSESMTKIAREVNEENFRLKASLERAQNAMVARRAPDASSGATLERISAVIAENAPGHDGVSFVSVEDAVRKVVAEWKGLRAMLSPHPMRAVAVRDDSTPALAERYALMFVEWDGKRLNLEMLEGPSTPWMDLVRPMNHAVSTRLVPPAFR